MSKIIVIESVEALAEQVIKAIGLWEVTETDTRTKDEVVLSCLHPIEVPNEAGELVNTIIMLFAEAQIKQTDEAITQALAVAAALITAYAKQVPEKLLSIIYNMPPEFYSDWLDHAKEICQDFGYTVKG